MSGTTFNKWMTPEEMQLKIAEVSLAHASLISSILSDPKRLRQLGEEAAASRALVDAELAKHEQALADIAAASAAHVLLDKKRADLEEREAILGKVHEDKAAQLAAAKVQLATERTATATELAKREEAIEARAAQVDQAALDAAAAHQDVDKRHAELDRRAKADGEEHAAVMKAAEITATNRTAQLDKREKALDAKAKKIEELKKAIKDD